MNLFYLLSITFITITSFVYGEETAAADCEVINNFLGRPLSNNCCTLIGITCQFGRIIKVDFSDCDLFGSIPSSFGTLSQLEELNLANNFLSGSIPYQIGNLSNLEVLDLQDNSLSGSLPYEIGNLYYLTTLQLEHNNISGSIPYELGNLSNLVTLDLSHNSLSGTIPAEIGNLSSIKQIDFETNSLSGRIPDEIGNLSSLEKLELQNNNLSGSIPKTIEKLSNLELFYINNNDFCGTLPDLPFFCDVNYSSNLDFGSTCPEDIIIYEPLPPTPSNGKALKIILIIFGVIATIALTVFAIYWQYFRNNDKTKKDEAPSETVNHSSETQQQSLSRNISDDDSDEIIVEVSKIIPPPTEKDISEKEISEKEISMIQNENTMDKANITDTNKDISNPVILNDVITKSGKNITSNGDISTISRSMVYAHSNLMDMTNKKKLDNSNNSIDNKPSITSDVAKENIINENNIIGKNRFSSSSIDKKHSSTSFSSNTNNFFIPSAPTISKVIPSHTNTFKNATAPQIYNVAISSENTANTYRVIQNTKEDITKNKVDSKISNENKYYNNINNTNHNIINSNINGNNYDLPPTYNEVVNEIITRRYNYTYSEPNSNNIPHNNSQNSNNSIH